MKLKNFINSRQMIYLYLSILIFEVSTKHGEHGYLQLINFTGAHTSTNTFLSSVGRQWYWKFSGNVQFCFFLWQFISHALFIESSTDLGHSVTIFFVDIDAEHAVSNPITGQIWKKTILFYTQFKFSKHNEKTLTR